MSQPTKFAIVIALLVVALAVNTLPRNDGKPAFERRLTQPLRLQLIGSDAIKQFLLGLRVHHYRAKPLGEAQYLDVYLDTMNWELFQHGLSFRIRTKIDPDGLMYSMHLEQEPRFVGEGEQKLEVSTPISMTVDLATVTSAFESVVDSQPESVLVSALNDVLKELQLTQEQLAPRLVGELKRARFDITDKGQNWFELDYENWRYYRLDADTGNAAIEISDIVIDTKLASDDPELLRRVRTMHQFAGMIDGVRFAQRAPFERAVSALGVLDGEG